MKKKLVGIFICTLMVTCVIQVTGTVNEMIPKIYSTDRQERDYGDAPEDGPAYPWLGVTGSFPTCKCCGPASWIEHNNFGGYFGQGVDFEPEGNGGLCPQCFPPYDMDERFQDGDAGLIMPEPYTIDNSLNVVPFTGYTGTPLGYTGQTAVWGVDVDIWVHNTMPNHEPYVEGYVNVLMDWNYNGIWNDNPGEHILINFLIPPLYIGPLSGLAPPNFVIGPNPGHVWTRFTITERPVQSGWKGDGGFEDGESEDYLLELIVEHVPVPNLDCEGSLSWAKVKTGSTVTGTFKVKNIGDPGSFLDWEVSAWPSWGTWTFNPPNGVGLPDGGETTITATCIAPTQKNQQFTGNIELRNQHNHADNCTIPVSLTTPKARTVHLDLQQLFEKMCIRFPILRLIS